ncbi:hypothetical protein ABID52_001642 [Fictibacillus halophilus]|uniref:Uncharacterized protein n=1 Tax=Fictibacillus halophilus TaxID=1610490 RepID=A0ABV2LHM0_9BACL|nr:hypothetical protein [Fictibacillus halophilus]
MFWFLAGIALFIVMIVWFVVFRGQHDFYLDQKEISSNNSMKRFVRYGTIVLRAKDD